MSDDLDAVIAAEEHRQGMPYDGGTQHCERCGREATLRRRAECEHEEVVEIATHGGGVVRRSCVACGFGFE